MQKQEAAMRKQEVALADKDAEIARLTELLKRQEAVKMDELTVVTKISEDPLSVNVRVSVWLKNKKIKNFKLGIDNLVVSV